jgi:hypothetical protein
MTQKELIKRIQDALMTGETGEGLVEVVRNAARAEMELAGLLTKGFPGKCIWDDCDQEAIYCEGHAREYVDPITLGYPSLVGQ